MKQEEIRTQENLPQHMQTQQPMYYPVPAPSGGGLMSGLFVLLILLGFGLIVYELYFVSPENSVINRIYGKLGTAQATHDDAWE